MVNIRLNVFLSSTGEEKNSNFNKDGAFVRNNQKNKNIKNKFINKVGKKSKKIKVVALVQKKKKSQPSQEGSQLIPLSQETINYKNVVLLRKCITNQGKILPRRISGLNGKQQRAVAKAIKNARIMALLPFVNKFK